MTHAPITRRLTALAFSVTLCWLVASATAKAASYEPNNTAAQATGPLAGGVTYSSTIETPDDEDWYWFRTTGERQLSLSAQSTTTDGYCVVQVEVLDEAGTKVDHFAILDKNASRVFRWTSPSAGKYLFRVVNSPSGTGDCGYGAVNTYSFSISPADAVAGSGGNTTPGNTTPPNPSPGTPVSAACKQAKSAAKKLSKQLKTMRKRTKRSRGAKRRSYNKRAKSLAKRVKSANRAMKAACTLPSAGNPGAGNPGTGSTGTGNPGTGSSGTGNPASQPPVGCPADGGPAPQAIKDSLCVAWRNAGGDASLGRALNEAHRWGAGWTRDFDGGPLGRGALLQGDGVGYAYIVNEPFWSGFLRGGGATGKLGYPNGRREPGGNLNRGGAASTQNMTFEGGQVINWANGTYGVASAIFERWAASGGVAGGMGRPTTDEQDSLVSPQGTAGRYQRFENGIVNYNAKTARAYLVIGAIGQKYAAMGYSASYLGEPTSDEYDWNGGRRQDYEGGYIRWVSGWPAAKNDREP